MKKHSFLFNKQEIPLNGIYILFERGEFAHNTNRITRIGTHDGDGRLKDRLKDHFLKNKQRDSIFRKHIGRCLLTKNNDPYIKKWDLPFKKKQDIEKNKLLVNIKYEKQYEQKITQYIQQNLSFVIIPNINLEVKRKYLERRLISTVSLCEECNPSVNWLGNYHPDIKIRKSGLWNIYELWKTPFSDKELEELKAYLK